MELGHRLDCSSLNMVPLWPLTWKNLPLAHGEIFMSARHLDVSAVRSSSSFKVLTLHFVDVSVV